MKLFIKWFIATVAVILTSYLLPGVELKNFWVAILVALVLGLINISLKPVLFILTLPINILTLGLFTLVINALSIKIASWLVDGFSIVNFWTALWFSIVLSIFSFILNKLFSKD